MTARPIRIVPLHRPSELFVPGRPAKAPAAQLTYRGGPLLTSVQVFSVFWGAAWQDPAQQSWLTTGAISTSVRWPDFSCSECQAAASLSK